MTDLFQITPPTVRAEGKDVPPEQIQAGFNSLARQVQSALNTVGSDPTGPAGGDLSGTYPNPTVSAVHATSGTMSGVAVTGGTIDNAPIGAITPNTGVFTTASAGSVFANGGAVPGVTATGTQVYNSPNPTVQFVDSIRSANNKNAFVTWGSTVLALGVANDAFTSFTNALAVTGGQASGISGITSTSGTGAWAHTGTFSATGGVNGTPVGNVTPSTGSFTTLTSTGGALNGSVGATTPNTGAFTTLTATTPVGVASGGTGLTNITAHALLAGNGTSAISQIGAGTTGQMLLGVTSGFPAFGNNPIITGGTVDGAAVGGATPSTGAFTTLSATSTVSGAGFTARFASPGPIGNTTASTGTFTTLSATGAITPSTTNGIVGTTAADNANAGSVGEYATANASGTSVTSGAAFNAASISLTAGDWDVWGVVQFVPAGSTTVSAVEVGISTTSATLAGYANNHVLFSTFATGVMAVLPTPVVRVNVATTTTVYLVGVSNFGVSTETANGTINARRVR